MKPSVLAGGRWLLLLMVVLGVALPLHAQQQQPSLSGLWQGLIVFRPAENEMEVTVEIAGAPPVGTIDVPLLDLKFHPLQTVKLDASQVFFAFERTPGNDNPGNRFQFKGELAPDGQKIAGTFSGSFEGRDLTLPFHLTRKGEAGQPRPAEAVPPVLPLSDTGSELRAAFNRDKDKVRLVALLSPTCILCLSSGTVIERYVLDTVKSDNLRVYMVWGPMLGDEKEGNARDAAAHMPDPRVTHFWTATKGVAAQFAKPINMPKGILGWETYQLFAPGTTWEDAVPAPARFMQMDRPLPNQPALNGETLASWIRDTLPPVPAPK